MEEKIRIQKYLSQSGVCSRRKAEEYIERGLVKVNGQIAKIGESIIAGKDEVVLLNKAIEEQKKFVYYKLNKPRGIETTCAQHNKKNIVDIMDIKERVFPIGRLDKDTTGLILMTNDGRLANFLMHPKYEHSKEYIVETFGSIDDKQLDSMRKGLYILGKITNKASISRISSGRFSIILTEGRNRQIRRMVEKVGSRVKKLKRIRIENILLGKMKIGEYKHLTNNELDTLFNKLGIKR
ncbi:rRNA pseudouridine synthase [Candidatus Gracilibacteria bacterium]|nr:rRNA pseudouridine synthase [Candidatus Gracilibacteria bacterium]